MLLRAIDDPCIAYAASGARKFESTSALQICGRINKIKIQIKSVFGSVLFEYEKEDNTVKDTVIEAIHKKAVTYYHPKTIFMFFKFIKLLPSDLYFKILSRHEDLRKKYRL